MNYDFFFYIYFTDRKKQKHMLRKIFDPMQVTRSTYCEIVFQAMYISKIGT